MSTISTTYNTPVQTNYQVDKTKPLTVDQIKAKVVEVQKDGIQAIEKGLEQNLTGLGNEVYIKVPADADRKPITNPSAEDWENAVKNDRFAEIADSPTNLADKYFPHLQKTGAEGTSDFATQIDSGAVGLADGGIRSDGIQDIPSAGKIIQDVLAALGGPYTSELKKADENRQQMDNLQKKNDALAKFENSLDVNSAGDVDVTINVPTSKYVYNDDGTKKLDSNGKPITEPITNNPLTNDDWAKAAEFKEVTGKAKDISHQYVNVTYATKGNHQENLTTNTGRFSNERQSVSSDLSKLSGQFDAHMANAQTNLQNANKIISNINDMNMSISRNLS